MWPAYFLRVSGLVSGIQGFISCADRSVNISKKLLRCGGGSSIEFVATEAVVSIVDDERI